VRSRITYFDDDNKLLAQVIAEAILVAPQRKVPSVVESYLVRNSGISAAQVYTHGRLLWKGELLNAPEPLDPTGLRMGNGARTVRSWRVFTFSRDGVRVQVGRRLAGLQATLHPYIFITFILCLALTLLSGTLAWFIAGVALRPLERLTHAALRGDNDHLEITGSDEVATLARSFSTLMAHLNSERERERRFLAYAAHELRTPISALRASLESARQQETPTGPERRALGGRFAQLHREALRLETFAQNLLALSRAEASEVRAQAIDLADLVSAAYDRFQPLALESGHEIVLYAEAAPVKADPRLCEQLLNNLLSNAIRHTSGGQITLRSWVSGDAAYLEVKDSGAGFIDGTVEGLGLRVIRSVVKAHGGMLDISVCNGSAVRVGIPARL
jgi:two-component system OmpR family sensor kinase